ncbi:hypothetical protein Q9189_001933 [Teloschistes chrysophthalmus]
MGYLGKRQTTYGGDTTIVDDDGNWWYSGTAEAIKWAIVAGIFFAVLLFFIGGYIHAKRRVRKGQQPLAYHRWLLRRSQRTRYPPARPYYNPHGNPYEMNAYPPPPPAYNSNEMPPPPMYEPPAGASKANPDQHYAPPSGPPPGHEASNAGPSTPTMHGANSSAEQYNNVPLRDEESQLPARPVSSGRSWNPLKRFQ